MDSQRNPHVLIDARMTDHPKLVELSSDGARWAWLRALCEAKLQRPSGRFASRRVLEHVLGSYAEWIGELVDAGLLEEAPLLCDRCAEAVGDVVPGTVVVHDWSLHQERRRHAEAQARYRERSDGGSSQRDHARITQPSPKHHQKITRSSREHHTTITQRSQHDHAEITSSRAGARPLQSQSHSVVPVVRNDDVVVVNELPRGGESSPSRARTREAWATPCPACGAQVDEPCSGVRPVRNGQPWERWAVHRERFDGRLKSWSIVRRAPPPPNAAPGGGLS